MNMTIMENEIFEIPLGLSLAGPNMKYNASISDP